MDEQATTTSEQPGRDSIVHIPEGMLGFSRLTRYVIGEDERLRPLLWLQCLDDESLAFPVVDPRLINPDYIHLLPTGELAKLRIRSRSELLVLAVAILRPAPGQSSVNLKAPLLINHATMIGRQIILEEPRAAIRTLLPELKPSALSATASSQPVVR